MVEPLSRVRISRDGLGMFSFHMDAAFNTLPDGKYWVVALGPNLVDLDALADDDGLHLGGWSNECTGCLAQALRIELDDA